VITGVVEDDGVGFLAPQQVALVYQVDNRDFHLVIDVRNNGDARQRTGQYGMSYRDALIVDGETSQLMTAANRGNDGVEAIDLAVAIKIEDQDDDVVGRGWNLALGGR
jgi:hypothetical protein